MTGHVDGSPLVSVSTRSVSRLLRYVTWLVMFSSRVREAACSAVTIDPSASNTYGSCGTVMWAWMKRGRELRVWASRSSWSSW